MLVAYVPDVIGKMNFFHVCTAGMKDEPGAKVTFKPGINTIASKVWESISTHPKVKKYIKLGALVVKTKVDPVADDAELKDLGAKKAQELVRQTFDIELLNKWSETENRATVQKTIVAQLEEIEVRTKVEKKKEGDEE